MLPVRDVPAYNPGSSTCPLQPKGVRLRLCLLAGGVIHLQPLEKVAAGHLVQGAHREPFDRLSGTSTPLSFRLSGKRTPFCNLETGFSPLVWQLPTISFVNIDR